MLFSLKGGSLKGASLLPARGCFEPPRGHPGPSSRPIRRSAGKDNSQKLACSAIIVYSSAKARVREGQDATRPGDLSPPGVPCPPPLYINPVAGASCELRVDGFPRSSPNSVHLA